VYNGINRFDYCGGATMDIHEIYQEDNKFEGEESIYYVLVGKGDSSRWDKSHKYYIITRSAVAIYDINAASMVKKIKVMTWPIPNEEHDAQEKNSGYFNRFKEGVIYKVAGRLQYSYFGELAFLYIREVLEENASGTKLDKNQEKYLAPIVLEDEVLGKLVLEKSEGLFEGKYDFAGNDITIYIEVEWDSKATWKKPLTVARDFAEHIASKDEVFRSYIASDEDLYDAALECVEEYEDECEIHFSTPEELNTKVYDEVITIENEDAFTEGRAFAVSEGILVGISSGATLKAATILAKRPENKGKTIVALLPDSGDRYLSTALFNN